MDAIRLDHLISAIGQAMEEACQTINRSGLAGYWSYFSRRDMPDGASAMVPAMQRVLIFTPDGSEVMKELHAPLVSLVPHYSFQLDQVKVRMKVCASLESDHLRVRVGPSGQQGSSDSLQGSEPPHEIELVFKRDEPAEGISRITQETVRLL
ncbi:MAG: DUF2589 domain-containing protein [Burkholderiaceae bacterium]|jgi:hypothetical protein|nr:DUF2589 domain-containing protein [Burkholderiaceae bacterium]